MQPLDVARFQMIICRRDRSDDPLWIVHFGRQPPQKGQTHVAANVVCVVVSF